MIMLAGRELVEYGDPIYVSPDSVFARDGRIRQIRLGDSEYDEAFKATRNLEDDWAEKLDTMGDG